jgi:tetraacyldisaccharide 4'-kinase
LNAKPVSARQRLQDHWQSRSALTLALWPLSALFGIVTSIRRAIYRSGIARQHRVGIPVIVVGNLIVGGAGKTPVVIALISLLRERGFTPGVVSRGYGRRDDAVLDVHRGLAVSECGDEPLLIHSRSGAPVVVGLDRTAACTALLRQHVDVDIVISDDGLQHLALARDVQVLVFDERGAGNGWLLPAGPLRESLPRDLPARTLVVYNAPIASTPLPGTLIRRSLARLVPLDAWWQGQPAALGSDIDSLRRRTVVAAAGLAHPQRFFRMLRELGLTIEEMPLPDHFDFATLPWPATTTDVIVTEKDAIKLAVDRTAPTRVWVAPLDFAFDTAFETALIALLPPPGTRHGNTPS